MQIPQSFVTNDSERLLTLDLTSKRYFLFISTRIGVKCFTSFR